MANFLDHQKRAKLLTTQKVSSDLFKFIKSIENEIFDLNINQLQKAENSEGEPLINTVKTASGKPKYTGVYSQLTADIASSESPVLEKKAGELYNFGYTGDFFNFEMSLFNDRVELFSTGTGSGEKKEFFDGYKSLYGLTPKSLIKIIEERLKPFLINYYTKSILG